MDYIRGLARLGVARRGMAWRGTARQAWRGFLRCRKVRENQIKAVVAPEE